MEASGQERQKLCFYLLRFTMAAGTVGWLEMERVRGESASESRTAS
jgi:hypothetical protein